MAKNVIMPALGMAQETGVLVSWLKKEGDAITKGEPIMEVETDKATVEIEAPASGVLANITAAPGDEIPVGEVIAVIVEAGEKAPPRVTLSSPAPAAPAKAAAPSASQTPAAAPIPAPALALAISPVAARLAAEHHIDLNQIQAPGGRITKADVEAFLSQQTAKVQPAAAGRILASPKARRLARERGIDLAVLSGSGPNGAVQAADVIAYSPQVAAVGVNGRSHPVETSRIWRIMAERLAESWRTVPHFYLQRDVDASRLIAWREMVMKRSSEKITYTDLLVKIAAEALRRHPRANASWLQETVMLNDDINIGLAVAVEDGLVVPVIHEADKRSLEELARRRQEVVERAQHGRLKQEDILGGTFTISNLGMYGVDRFSAIVNPPQAAILAVGRIADRVVPVNGAMAIRPIMTLTLSLDHRAVDGARGAQFLDTLSSLVEEPLGLIE